jgi:hypothetical protein
MRTGRRRSAADEIVAVEPQCRSPLSISPSAATARIRPTPRLCSAYFLEDHRPSPRTRRCLHAFALLLHLYWRFPCRCFSPLFLLFSFRLPPVLSVPPDPCSIRSPLSSLHLLVVVPESRPDSSQPLPQISRWGGGVVGNWRRGILGSTKPNLRRLSSASDERIEQGSGGTCRRVSDTARRWWPARGGRVSCATRWRSSP